MPSYQRVDVSLAASPVDGLEIVKPGRVVQGIYVPNVPAGLTSFRLRFGNQDFIPVSSGDFFDLECDEASEGIRVDWAPNIPGTTAAVFVFASAAKKL